MQKGVKIALWTLGIGGVLYLALKGGQKIADANSFINNVQFNITPSAKPIQVTSLNNIQLNLDVYISNPTKFTIDFEKPIVTIFYGDTILAQSKMPDTATPQIVEIKPQAISKISLSFDIAIWSNILTWIDIGKTIGKNVSSQTGVNEIANIVAANAQKVMKLLRVRLLTYYGDTPIPYETTLG